MMKKNFLTKRYSLKFLTFSLTLFFSFYSVADTVSLPILGENLWDGAQGDALEECEQHNRRCFFYGDTFKEEFPPIGDGLFVRKCRVTVKIEGCNNCQ